MYEMALPRFAHAMTEGEIVEWFKDVGDHVDKDEVLFTLLTEKATVEIESPVAGTITEIKVAPGTTVPVGEIVALIDIDD
jgi:pyruvate/2-oxoglutarate dehydrogenase complex dihydrolipoamide acyltransferase (E2) component